MSKTVSSSSAPYARIAVIGAGAWGTALSVVAAEGGAEVTLWAREKEMAEGLNHARENSRYLPAIALPDRVQGTADPAAVRAAEAVLMVVPAQHLRAALEAFRPHLLAGVPVVLCAKGIETGSGLLLAEILEEMLPDAEPAILSGPSFARDVARGLPTAVAIAARETIASRLAATLGRAPAFRPYVSEDVTGVALGGAAKNVYAIGCGMVEGAGLGESARAALLARSFAELLRLGASMNVRAETLMGLSGLGDLVLTATSSSSRNFAFGEALGRGAAPAHKLAEGVATAPALVARARRHGVELPVAEAIAEVLAGRCSVKQAAERLLARPLKAE